MAEARVDVVDVREPGERANARIAGTRAVALSVFDANAARPAEGRVLVFHCHSGQRCGTASAAMLTAGYDGEILRLAGGILAWHGAGLALESGPE
jgi:rhodanese-related sulfurtransferase